MNTLMRGEFCSPGRADTRPRIPKGGVGKFRERAVSEARGAPDGRRRRSPRVSSARSGRSAFPTCPGRDASFRTAQAAPIGLRSASRMHSRSSATRHNVCSRRGRTSASTVADARASAVMFLSDVHQYGSDRRVNNCTNGSSSRPQVAVQVRAVVRHRCPEDNCAREETTGTRERQVERQPDYEGGASGSVGQGGYRRRSVLPGILLVSLPIETAPGARCFALEL